MNTNAEIYYFYKSFPIRFLRFLIFIIFLYLDYLVFSNGLFYVFEWRLFLFLTGVFFLTEIFFRFKTAKTKPQLTIAENFDDFTKSFTLEALWILNGSGSSIVKKMMSKDQIKFLLGRADISVKEVLKIDVKKEDIIKLAFKLARDIGGKFVTVSDIFCAYLLITEPETKLLFKKKLKEEELIRLLHWTRFEFPKEENPKPVKVQFWGEGIGEEWVYGWTLETKKYTVDITQKVLRNNPVLLGRQNEFRSVVEALSRKEKNSVLLVGDSGTGKSALIEKLALDSIIGNLGENLYHRRFLQLMVGPLLSGVRDQGQLELRIQSIIEEISHSVNVILFIPQMQDILGSSSFHLDLSGALFPYLKNGVVRIIATTDNGNYKKFIEPSKAFADFFEIIKLEEPDKNTAIQMLMEKAGAIEWANNVTLTYRAIVASVDYSKKYIPNKSLPGVAVTLLEDTANSVYITGKKNVEAEDVIKKVEEKTKIALEKPKGQEKELLLNFEKKIHERLIDQEEAVSAIAEALRRLRSGLITKDKPISFLFLGPTGVGKTQTAKEVASLYFGGEEKMIRLDMSEYSDANGEVRLLGAGPGGGDEKGELTEKVYEKPFSLVLLDEFEKASPNVLDLFLQVFEDGRLTDNKGKTVSFIDCIVIATSNAASEFIREEIEKGGKIDKNFQSRLLDFLQTKGIFKPELLNRFDGIIVFKPLAENEVLAITKLLLDGVVKKLSEQDITVSFDERIIAKIAKDGFNKDFGARPIRRFIQDDIEDLLAKKIISEEIKRGNKINFSTDTADNITVSVD